MIVKGRNRDTAWFGLTDEKWHDLSDNYKQWLDEFNPLKRNSLRIMNDKVKKYSKVRCED